MWLHIALPFQSLFQPVKPNQPTALPMGSARIRTARSSARVLMEPPVAASTMPGGTKGDGR